MLQARFRLVDMVEGIAHVAEVEVRVEPADQDEIAVSDGAFAWRREVYGPAAVVLGPSDDRLTDEAVAGVRNGLALLSPDADSLDAESLDADIAEEDAGDDSGIKVTVLRICDFSVDTSPGDVEMAARQALYLALGIQPESAPRGRALPPLS